MNTELFITLMLVCSSITGLATEAIKKIFDEYNIKYHSNTLAGIVCFFICTIICILYVLFADNIIIKEFIGYSIVLAIGSWLCAMLGYDKVIQTITQFKK